jgi:hypothetical protein
LVTFIDRCQREYEASVLARELAKQGPQEWNEY